MPVPELVATRDLAQRASRVCTIAPDIFGTPLLARLPENVRASLGAWVQHPPRLGQTGEFAALVLHVLENAMLNSKTIRINRALRMQPCCAVPARSPDPTVCGRRRRPAPWL